jgi:hypothetical protein
MFIIISSYTRDIDGINIDLAGGSNPAAIRTADFVFKAGDNNSPGARASVTVVATVRSAPAQA